MKRKLLIVIFCLALTNTTYATNVENENISDDKASVSQNIDSNKSSDTTVEKDISEEITNISNDENTLDETIIEDTNLVPADNIENKINNIKLEINNYEQEIQNYENLITDLEEELKKLENELHLSSIKYNYSISGENIEPLSFVTLNEAINYISNIDDEIIVTPSYDDVFSLDTVLYKKTDIKGSYKIPNVPMTYQMPELPRGCEVTSLNMLLNFNGFATDKMTLAEEVKKSPHKYDDLNNGFVGNMYNYDEHGIGVYVEPIFELAKQYTNNSVNLTGTDFNNLYYYLDNDMPIWVITTSRYTSLTPSDYYTWTIPNGEKVDVTYKMHSVLVTGYDENYIYVHDPYTGSYKKANKNNFIHVYNQMGKQSLTILNNYLTK